MDGLRIRPASLEDLPELVRIYNHYVKHTPITFDIATLSVEERRAWFEGFREAGAHRLLVAERDSLPVGYTSSSKFRVKPAYASSVETTIYLDPDCVGRGIGRTLYRALLRVLEEEPAVHRAYGGVALPNPRSVRLHEQLGFRMAGTFREVGFKFGKFWDVSWYERDVSDKCEEPA